MASFTEGEEREETVADAARGQHRQKEVNFNSVAYADALAVFVGVGKVPEEDEACGLNRVRNFKEVKSHSKAYDNKCLRKSSIACTEKSRT